MSWTTRTHGHDYSVEVGDATREAVLLADGVEVDRQTAGYWESATLKHADTTIEARWGPRNNLVTCQLVANAGGVVTKTPLAPPAGSKAAKAEALAREHPTLFVLRRVAQAGLEVLFGVLGVSALVAAFFGGLLPRLDLSWVPDPSVPGWVPDVSAPGWLRYVDPVYWFGRLGLSWPDVAVPGWLEAALDQKKYWLPLVVAALIAVGELDRRKKRDAERAADRDDA